VRPPLQTNQQISPQMPPTNRVERARKHSSSPSESIMISRSRARPRINDPEDKTEKEPPSLNLERVLSLAAKIGSPIAIGTALLFYFGWIRAESQARALGYDVTLLGLTTSDYVLRSINVLFLPIIILLLLALAGQMIHPILVNVLQRHRTGNASRLVLSVLRMGWLWLPIFGIAAFAAFPSVRPFIVPVTLTAGVLLTIYGDRLYRRLNGRPPMRTAVLTLVLLILGILVFWDVERIAAYMGTQFAEYISKTPDRYAEITLYSPKDLELPTVVHETQIGTENSAYRYRYDGLHLLLRSDGKLFMMAYRQNGSPPAIIVLPESEQIRIEFTP
jgi:hypothetical protein